jgi:hypothetical protein
MSALDEFLDVAGTNSPPRSVVIRPAGDLDRTMGKAYLSRCGVS